jgi:hypothetical protein
MMWHSLHEIVVTIVHTSVSVTRVRVDTYSGSGSGSGSGVGGWLTHCRGRGCR